VWPADPTGASPATVALSFALASPATVTWTILDAGGRVVLTHLDRAALGPGSYAFTWDGRDATGMPVAPGAYRSSVVAAANGLAARLTTAVAVGPFGLTASSATATRGATITLTAVPAGPTVGAPIVAVSQPGVAPRVVAMTAATGGRYVARIAVARSLYLGTLVLTVTGTTASGAAAGAQLVLPIR
jgi:hypothetical protein